MKKLAIIITHPIQYNYHMFNSFYKQKHSLKALDKYLAKESTRTLVGAIGKIEK